MPRDYRTVVTVADVCWAQCYCWSRLPDAFLSILHSHGTHDNIRLHCLRVTLILLPSVLIAAEEFWLPGQPTDRMSKR